MSEKKFEVQELSSWAPSIVQQYVKEKPEYAVMINKLEAGLPAIREATDNFNKTQSQFMDNMLTVSHPTPLRNIRQILAEMNKTDQALKEAYIKCAKKEVEIEKKLRALDSEEDELEVKMLQLDIVELKTQLESTKGYIGGAIRKLSNYQEQYSAIMQSIGKESLTEADFEEEEERYHIMKAFDQGTTAARSRQFMIDEGNLIYLTQIGINAGVAQKDVANYLYAELELIKSGQEPTHNMYIKFLNDMADKHTGCSNKAAISKGMTGKLSELATLGYKK
jgi:paraquat-inducible protein B